MQSKRRSKVNAMPQYEKRAQKGLSQLFNLASHEHHHLHRSSSDHHYGHLVLLML